MGLLDFLFGSPKPRRSTPKSRGKRVVLRKGSSSLSTPAWNRKAIEALERRGYRRVERNPKLTATERAKLDPSVFAVPDRGVLPVQDAGHVRSTIGRFGSTPFENMAEAREAARRIIAAAQQHDVAVGEHTLVAQVAGVYAERVPERRRRRNLDAFTDASGAVHPIRGSQGYDEIMVTTPEVKAMRAARLATYGGDTEADWRESWGRDEGDWADAVRKAVKSVSRYGIAPHSGKQEGWEYRHDVPLYLKDRRGLPADEVAHLLSYQYPQLGIESEDDLLQALAEGTRERHYNPAAKPTRTLPYSMETA